MRNKFRIALLSMAAVGLVGCADKLTDDVAQGGQGNGDEAENYVVFKIGNIGSETRAGDTPGAGDFLEGLAEEHAVSTKAGANFVYFFTEGDDATLLQATPLEVLGQTDDPTHKPDHDEQYNDSGNEKVYQARIKGTEEELKKYKQCLVILNGDPQTLNDLQYKEEQNNGETTKAKRTLNEVLEALDKTYMGWYKDGSTTYFTMSNTVYVDEENDLNVKSAKEIRPGQICKTMAEAQKDPIIVHVERVLAKFELNKVQGNTTTLIADGTTDEERTIEPTKEGDKGENLYITMMTSTEEDGTGNDTNYGNNEEDSHYTEWKATNHLWKVKIVGWGMNATESETYWVKNLKASEGKFGSWNYNYENDTFGWNDYNRVRSYWAVDPHYNGAGDEAKYPHQYRTAADKDNIVPGTNGAGGLKADLILKYNSYEDLAKLPSKGYNYSVENTFDYSSSVSTEEPIDYSWFTKGKSYDFGGTGYKRTGTHAIVAAELLIADDDKGTNYAAKTVYQYDSYYWEAEGDEDTKRYQDMSKSLKKYMLNQVLFHWSLENDFKELYVDEDLETPLVANSDNFDKYFEVVAATIKGGDGRAMMQLRSKDSEGNDVKLWFLDKDNNKLSIANASGNAYINDFNKNFLYQYGTARRFEGGKMYYYIPIKHMSAEGEVDGEYEYNVGKWGVVRNHWYRLNINAIKNPGIPVDDPDQPIIPNDDPEQDYYAAFEIVILPWHVIDNNVTFE